MSSSRSRRERRRRAQIVAEIHETAHGRQEAWSEGDQPNTTAALTTELDLLYGDLRTDRREAYAVGQESEGTPYRGRTSKAGR